jgi:DNA-directed RNA polymerase specialized sigma24 family protein
VAVEEQESGPLSQLELETDEVLFLHLACRTVDPATADEALQVLWTRHRDYLLRSCHRLCRHLGVDTGRVDDLAAATWAKVNERADQYLVGAACTFDAQVRRTRAWMNTIAEHQLIDWLRNPHRAIPPDERLDRSVEDYSSQDFAALCAGRFQAHGSSYRLSLIARAFDELLSEKEQFVLRATVVHSSYSPKGTYMQRGSTTALAATLSITAAGVRKCRSRAFQKIADFLLAQDRNRSTSK